MKGIILETMENHAVVLTKSGDYKKVRLDKSIHYACGDEIEINKFNFKLELPKLQWNKYRVQFSILAILLVIMVFPGMNYYQANQVAGHVNIDINPSVELTYNKQMKVIKANSLNDDGKMLLSKKEILKMDIQDAVNSLIVLAMEEGYITSEKDNGIIISITDIKGELYKDELSKKVEKSIKNVKSIEVEYIDSDVGTFEKAQKLKKSPGKVMIEEKVSKSRQDTENREMTTYELVSLYHEYKNAITEENGKNDKGIANEDEKNTNKQEKKNLLDDIKNIREERKDREKEEKLKEKEIRDERKDREKEEKLKEKEIRDERKEEEKKLRDERKEEEKRLKDERKEEEKRLRDEFKEEKKRAVDPLEKGN